MNRIFFFSVMTSVAVLASCGGKVLVDGLPPNGGGGAGGAGGATTTNSSASSSSQANTSAVTSTGVGQTSTASGSSCDPNYSCAEAITPPTGDPQLLCPGSPSNNLYQQLLKCTCGGPCAAACAATACLGQMPSNNCLKCTQDTMKGCGKEFQACANDL